MGSLVQILLFVINIVWFIVIAHVIMSWLIGFNVLNRQNPAAVGRQNGVALQPFGQAIQVLPGREGQLGFRIEF